MAQEEDCVVPNETTAGPSPCEGFASAVGFALGDLLLLHEQPEKLGECLHCIQTTAYASILSADLRAGRQVKPRAVDADLARAALDMVRGWYEETGDLNAVREAIEALQGAFESIRLEHTESRSEEE